ncbi:MAG: shikimate kinase [bacterium]
MVHIILIGMMGSGKTTIGRILSQMTGRIFIDTDQLIEKKLSMSVYDIITNKGEDFFRKEERDIILSISPSSASVIATGGGAVMNDEVFIYLKQIGRLVYLKATPMVLYKRTANVNTRPLLKGEDRLNTIHKLLEAREPRYLKADIIVDTDNSSPTQVAEEIIKRLTV